MPRGGAQIAIDVTLRSVLTSEGEPHPRTAATDAVVANAARQDKERKYPEFFESHRCVLVVLALELGGRWSNEAYAFIEELAWAKSREAPPPVRKSARLSWHRRWVRMLSCTAARAWSGSLVAPTGAPLSPMAEHPVPDWHEV